MEKIVIFGASLGGERALRSLGRNRKAVAFSDNDARKHDSKFHGLPVIKPSDLPGAGFDRVLIASTYYPEIYDQLVTLGIPIERIEVLDADILEGYSEKERNPRIILGVLVAGAVVILVLAGYGLYRLVAG